MASNRVLVWGIEGHVILSSQHHHHDLPKEPDDVSQCTSGCMAIWTPLDPEMARKVAAALLKGADDIELGDASHGAN